MTVPQEAQQVLLFWLRKPVVASGHCGEPFAAGRGHLCALRRIWIARASTARVSSVPELS